MRARLAAVMFAEFLTLVTVCSAVTGDQLLKFYRSRTSESHHPRPEAPGTGPDWANGLPSGAISVIVKAGGCAELKAMRGVNKCWKEEYDASVREITIGMEGPPPNDLFSDRFLSLTKLDMGACIMSESGLSALSGLKKVVSLGLGVCNPDLSQGVLADRRLGCLLTSAGLKQVRSFPLTELYLGSCSNLSASALNNLHGMPLATLSLDFCPQLKDSHLKRLKKLPLTELSLRESGHWDEVNQRHSLSCAGLLALKDLPLTFLNLCATDLRDSDLKGLEELAQLVDLDLSFCGYLTSTSLELLSKLPLRRLVLGGFGQTYLNDRDLELLRAFPLTSLDLSYSRITDAGLALLRGMPLVNLDLSGCLEITIVGMQHLKGLPLARLNAEFSDGQGIGFEELQGLVGDVLPVDVHLTKDEEFLL